MKHLLLTIIAAVLLVGCEGFSVRCQQHLSRFIQFNCLLEDSNPAEFYPRLSPYCHPLRAGSLMSASNSGWPLTFIFLLSHSMFFPVR